MKKAFTMIELVFVIVILGILASVAIPRMSGMTQDAEIAKGQADVSTIRSAIVNERQSRLILGDSTWITSLTPVGQTTPLFDGNSSRSLLTYGVVAGATAGHWSRGTGANTNQYTYRVGTTATVFTYTATGANAGQFNCTADTGNCNDLTR